MPLGQRKSLSERFIEKRAELKLAASQSGRVTLRRHVSNGTHGYSDKLEHLAVTLVRTEHW